MGALVLPLVIVMAMLLSACGDGGGIENGGGDDNDGGIPLSSAEEFSKWAASRSPDDASEPLGVEGISPPTSDTTEPLVL